MICGSSNLNLLFLTIQLLEIKIDAKHIFQLFLNVKRILVIELSKLTLKNEKSQEKL
jgi:hypothetical protein